MSAHEYNFNAAFEAVTGYPPFPWQIRLYEEWFSRGRIPQVCSLSTGLGKTSVMPIWLIALAHGSLDGRPQLPRRLVYVVNRRTVVDQATREAERLRENLKNLEKPELVELAKRLQELCAIKTGVTDQSDKLPLLAISTLRGQFADNGEWCADPARPAIIVGTVDMIGSRLLFSGYGRGFKSRPLHAGFLGQDTLLVHDEAHLEPAFQKLLIAIEKEQGEGERSEQLPWPKLRVLELSATSRQDDDEENTEHPFGLTDKEKNPPTVIPNPPTEPIHHVWRRIKAKKAIHLTENKDQKKLADEIADFALKRKDSGRAVLVFVRKVEDVETVVARLKKDKQEVQQLTGTLRGLERDELVKDPIFVRFLPSSNRPEGVTPTAGTVYLVCTSAGEVGIDISADHLVCDLSTFESMAQRFGRVNRFGDRGDTEIHVVYPKEFGKKDKNGKIKIEKLDQRRQMTLELLKQLKDDASPLALSKLDPDKRSAAFSPLPEILPATDILFDAWALTTIRDKLPGRPPVEPYLHGISDWQPPETHVAWREEVGVIKGELLEKYKPRNLLDDYPLKPHELLRNRSDRVFKHLQAMAKEHPDAPVWIVDGQDQVSVTTLKKLSDGDKATVNHVTVLLPPSVGGLTQTGTLDGTAVRKKPKAEEAVEGDQTTDEDKDLHYDVADEWFSDKDKTTRRRVRVWDDDPEFDKKTKDMRLARRRIDTRPDADEFEEEEGEGTPRRFWYWYEHPKVGDSDGSKWSSKAVLWQVHTDDVAKNATAIAEKLLTGNMKQAVILAAKWHDLGKQRAIFQRILGNYGSELLLSKSGMKHGRIPEQYRHEFGSLLDVLHGRNGSKPLKEFASLSEETKDLVLHLIAAHHGYARPHFPPDNAYDPEKPTCEWHRAAAEIPRRFARLQRKYGRWGLAYLESLLRAADWAASANPFRTVEEAANSRQDSSGQSPTNSTEARQ